MKSHQRLIRERESLTPVALPFVPDLARAEVRQISYHRAKPFILRYEWLGTMAPTKYHYGLFFDPLFDEHMGGAVCIGGTNCTGGSYLHTMFHVQSHQVGVFARGACAHWCPPHAGSYLIASALRRLRQDSPYKLVIAYADPDAGEIGTLYQASNWTYIGVTSGSAFYLKSPDSDYRFESASIIVEAQKRKLRWRDVYREYLDKGWTKIKKSRKHRYVFVLDKRDRALRDLVAAMSKPYPKRQGSAS